MLDAYTKRKGDRDVYESALLMLMKKREIEKRLDPDVVTGGCLLCSEHGAHHCPRRLVAEYPREHWDALTIDHLD